MVGVVGHNQQNSDLGPEGARLRLIAGVCKFIGKPGIIFILNKENDLTVYR